MLLLPFLEVWMPGQDITWHNQRPKNIITDVSTFCLPPHSLEAHAWLCWSSIFYQVLNPHFRAAMLFRLDKTDSQLVITPFPADNMDAQSLQS